MIVAALRGAHRSSASRRVSLNFAVFRSALERGGRLGAGPVLRAWRELLLFASRWFQIESLYRFNAKFRPVWEPRFVCYPGAGDLPANRPRGARGRGVHRLAADGGRGGSEPHEVLQPRHAVGRCINMALPAPLPQVAAWSPSPTR